MKKNHSPNHKSVNSKNILFKKANYIVKFLNKLNLRKVNLSNKNYINKKIIFIKQNRLLIMFNPNNNILKIYCSNQTILFLIKQLSKRSKQYRFPLSKIIKDLIHQLSKLINKIFFLILPLTLDLIK